MMKAVAGRITCLMVAGVIAASGTGCIQPAYGASSVNSENLISSVNNPSNGVIKYVLSVPPGKKVNYSVELPSDKSGSRDYKSGSWTNKTKKTVKKTVTVKVKCMSDRYRIRASYSASTKGKTVTYRDEDKVVSSFKSTVVTTKLSWNFSKLGKGEKSWKYRYRYVPYNKGYKKYMEVYNSKGTRIKNVLKETVPVSRTVEFSKIR